MLFSLAIRISNSIFYNVKPHVHFMLDDITSTVNIAHAYNKVVFDIPLGAKNKYCIRNRKYYTDAENWIRLINIKQIFK